jgi:hypothetical protein
MLARLLKNLNNAVLNPSHKIDTISFEIERILVQPIPRS